MDIESNEISSPEIDGTELVLNFFDGLADEIEETRMGTARGMCDGWPGGNMKLEKH
jgi:hypothetical protein